MEQTIINDYTQKANLARQEAHRFKKLANTYSLARLIIFALIVLATGLAVKYDNFTILAVAFVLLVFAFMWLVSRQGIFDRQKEYFQNLEKVYENEISSITSHANIYDNGQRFADDKHYYSADLDIFGPASLFQLINRAATSTGNLKLAAWLDAPAGKEEVLLRQQAVKEITQKGDWNAELQARLVFAIKADADQLPNLFKYMGVPVDMPGEKWLNIYAKIAPFLLLAAIIAAIFYPRIQFLAILLGLGNLGLVVSKAFYIKKADLIAGKIGGTLNNYAIVFEKIESQDWTSVWCSGQVKHLQNRNTSAKIKELSALIDKLNYHFNMVAGFIMNLFFVWDIRQVIAIENWKRNNKEGLEEAFEVVAAFEALISIASPAINYPEWNVAEIADGAAYTLSGKAIGHPLIKPEKRVVNDYELTDTFGIDIITGSNMAGKSTFLRTVGVNAVLALSGAPVCAENFRVSVMTILSYMRIKDSLNESTSTFKAELDRLQMLLAAVDSEQKIFFLIDEMLRGTNSVDKYLGSKAVIEQLIRKRGVGMVATHDLQIAELESTYPNYVRNYYFDIQVKDGEMLFDYKIKHGKCTTFNASLLLRQIGVEVGE
jgi:DNA mismatch repair ATPase MutS